MIAPIAMRMFLRQSAIGREPLAVAMSGVRMGERLLQIGVDDPDVAGALASKPGLSGESVIVVANDDVAVRARRSVDNLGAAATIRVHPVDRLPFEDASFDVVVVHAVQGLQATMGGHATSALRECHRLLRSGGRVVALERGTPSGLKALFHGHRGARSRGSESPTPEHLIGAGFRGVRLLGDRDGYLFFEGMKA